MFTHLLLATDGSDCAVKAANTAVEIAKKFNSKVTVVSVYFPAPLVAPYGEALYAGPDSSFIDDVQNDALARTTEALCDAQIAFDERKELGNAAQRILEVAKDEECDLIVLGSRGLSGIASFLLGSVSDRVTHHAHCPVLIVR